MSLLDGSDDVTVTDTCAENPAIVGSSASTSPTGGNWLIPLVGAAAPGALIVLPELSSDGSVAAGGSADAETVEAPVHADTPAPANHVEQPREEQRGGMLAQTGADVLLLIVVAFFLMGLGLLLVQRRRT